ncbi:MAG TPA: S9 family peptidase [Flavobacteriales bacterium]|nr:S9 family peptidase [Flavobacteriales bacterium]
MIRMRTYPTLLASVLVMFNSLAADAQPNSPFTYRDMLLLDRISGLAVDPAGTKALFNVRATDMEKNRGVSTLWMKDLADPAKAEMKVPAGEGGASDMQWAADGSAFYFLSGRGDDGITQVWRSDAEGRMAAQVTNLALDVLAYRIAPDGSGLVVSLAVFPGCTGDAITCTAERIKAKKEEKSTGQLYDGLFVRHWDTWADGTRNHLFYLPLPNATAKPIALTPELDGDVPSKPWGDNSDFVIGPDGRTVYYSVRIAGKTEPWSTNFDIYSVPVTGGPAKNLTADNTAWDANPRISPNGSTLAYVAMQRPGYEADRFVLHVLDLATGKVTVVAKEWDRSIGQLQWSRDGKSVLVTTDDIGKHRLFRIDSKTGTVTPLSTNGHMDAFVETPKGFVFQKSGLSSPAQLYVAAPKAMRIDQGATTLTQVNAGLKNKVFGAFQQFSFPGWNNETVYGYVLKPASFTEGKKYPVAFLIHGGPQGSFGESWSYRWNPQTYAGEGYAVVMIDFHGSTGYGQGFTDAIKEHWGDRPLEDLQKGLAHALEQYPYLDADRVVALGASYGGYMVNWIAGVWNEPFKALVSHCGIFDTRMMGYATEELWFTDWENGGSVFTKPDNYDTFNPMLHADKWRVPMLVVHGDKDYRVPMEQGIGTFTACQAKGIASKYLRFPDENHWVLKPQNSMQWHATVFEWLNEYTGAQR